MKNYALGRMKQGVMNKTEARYKEWLDDQMRMGEIVWYKFDGVKLRLADATFYSPDFAVLRKNGQLEIHEVKGYWQDDAKVKIKVASDMYPFVFYAVYELPKKHGGGWKWEEF